MDKCYVCGQNTDKSHPDHGKNIQYLTCERCGQYSIHAKIINILTRSEVPIEKHILSGILREASENGNPIEIKEDNIQDILDSSSVPHGPFEKIDRIVKYIHQKSPNASSCVPIGFDDDYPIAYANNPEEFKFYLDKAVELGYLELNNVDDVIPKCRLTLKAWKRLDELRKKQVESNQAFVAMWFDDKLKPAWEDGFRPALSKTGYKPIRIDLVEHNEKICDRIIAEIRKSGLLVADFTGNCSGVYYEVGFAQGLGIPVIWTCRKDYEKKLHFDIRQYNNIFWETSKELKERLINRIEASLPNRTKNLDYS